MYSSQITLLFEALTTLEHKQQLTLPERAFLQEISTCLDALTTWISMSESGMTLNIIQENVEGTCQMYPQEVSEWAQDIHTPINHLVEQARTWLEQQQKRSPSHSPHFLPTLSDEEAYTQALLLKALADPTRLQILNVLSRHEGNVCVKEIVESFPLEQPTISYHLRILRTVGLIGCRKYGQCTYYYIEHNTIARCATILAALLPTEQH